MQIDTKKKKIPFYHIYFKESSHMDFNSLVKYIFQQQQNVKVICAFQIEILIDFLFMMLIIYIIY